MTETPELKDPDEPGAPSPKRPDRRVTPAETQVIPPSARADYLAPDGSTDAGQGEDDDGDRPDESNVGTET